MNEFSEECLITFLRNQEQLFPEPVAETVEEAEAFLEDCMAVVVDTLEEVKESDLFLLVVDTSFEDYHMQIETTNEVLKSLGVENTPMIYVYNKIDLNKYAYIQPQSPYVFISAKYKRGLDLLEDEISHLLFKDYEVFELSIPYSQGEDFKYLHQHCYVKEIEYLEKSIYLKIEARKQEIKNYLHYCLIH